METSLCGLLKSIAMRYQHLSAEIEALDRHLDDLVTAAAPAFESWGTSRQGTALEVAARLEAYTKEHSLDSADLLNLALERGYIEPAIARWGEKITRLVDDFDLFDWPLEEPLSCVVIGLMRQLACRCAKKMREKHDVTESDQADWWKES